MDSFFMNPVWFVLYESWWIRSLWILMDSFFMNPDGFVLYESWWIRSLLILMDSFFMNPDGFVLYESWWIRSLWILMDSFFMNPDEFVQSERYSYKYLHIISSKIHIIQHSTNKVHNRHFLKLLIIFFSMLSHKLAMVNYYVHWLWWFLSCIKS